MWRVVYHRRYIAGSTPETFRFQSKSWFRAFLVYLNWRMGYTLSNYEVRDIKFYEVKRDNLIILDAHRKQKGRWK